MNICIAMAGRGQRFVDKGYTEPKPFIKIYGRRMVDLVLENLIDNNLEIHESNFYFYCLKSFLDKYGKEFESYLKNLNYTIIPVKEVTEGCACTVLLGKEFINNHDELLITDIDHLVLDKSHINHGLKFFRKNNAQGGLWCFWNDNPKWSYIKISNGEVREVAEKNVISNFANTGTYYFAKGRYFVDAAETMISKNIRVNNEYYISPCYTQMIIYDMKILPFFVNEFIALGTPTDLELYIKQVKK